MLDFPTPTSIGQVYAGTNGVNYIWTGTLWLASGASAGGDFCATGGLALSTGLTTLVLPTIISGNSTGTYNTSTGQWMPPAGRYFIYSYCSGYSSSAATNVALAIRKNGTTVFSNTATTGGTNQQAVNVEQGTVDANGSDIFDVQGSANPAGNTGNIYFGAFPVSGIKGPPGDPYSMTQVGGDFCATLVGPAALATSAAVVGFPAIISGNSGGWLNTSTGAYTPPAGRYFLTAQFHGNLGGAATNLWVGIRKNGGTVSSGYSTTASAAYSTLTSCAVTVDANGSDIFTVAASGDPGPAYGYNFLFTAYPISGIKGPPGDLPSGSGDVVSSVVTAGVSCPNITPTNIASISLVAGDWDVYADCYVVTPAGGAIYVSINSVSASTVTAPALAVSGSLLPIGAGNTYSVVPRACRASVSVTTTYYLVVQANAGNSTGTGTIWARRAK